MLPPTPHNIILLEVYFRVKFPLLRLLHFLSDFNSTILFVKYLKTALHKNYEEFLFG